MKNHISIDIEASPESVFPWIDDPQKLQTWLTTLTENEILASTENKVGSTFRQVYLDHGRRMEMRGRVTAYELNHRLACEIKGPVFDLDVDYQLEDLGGRTRLTQDSTIRMKGIFKVVSLIMAPFVRKASSKQAEDGFEKLKRLAETH